MTGNILRVFSYPKIILLLPANKLSFAMRVSLQNCEHRYKLHFEALLYLTANKSTCGLILDYIIANKINLTLIITCDPDTKLSSNAL